MTRFFYIRHGQTHWNSLHKLQGRADIPLSRRGVRQAKRAARQLKHTKIDIIFVSPLWRARHTAELINKYHNVKIIEAPEFKELKVGILEGMTLKNAEKKLGKVYNDDGGIKDYLVKGAESNKQTETRVYPAFLKLLKKYPEKSILIAAHEHVGMVLLRRVFGKKFKKYAYDPLKNASITEFDIKKNKVKVIRYNDVRHLF